jgi:putative ABC transport system substrate-binding protein
VSSSMPRFCVALSMIALVALTCCKGGQSAANLPVIAITQIATEPALDEVRSGIIAGLQKRGYSDGRNVKIVFENANGDASLTVPIAQEFVRMAPAVIVPISTPSTLSVAKITSSIPIVFSGVTDPVGIGLIKSLDKPGGNITGVSDQWPFRAQVSAFLRVLPQRRRIGMLYTKGDDVSKIGVEAMTKLSMELGFSLRSVPLSSGADVYPSAVALFRDVDVIYTGIDHLVLENLDSLVKASREARKPLFGGESGSVEKGAVLALTINMSAFGDETAGLIEEVLRGQKPGDIPVVVVTNGDLIINRETATQYGINVDLLQREGAKVISGAN